MVHISVIIPAHNEANYIARCIKSIKQSAKQFGGKVEIIDNRMMKGTLSEIYKLLRTGKYIGGGAPIRFERYSFPLWCNDILCRVSFGITGLIQQENTMILETGYILN